MFDILQKIASQNKLNLIDAKSLPGGDINQVFLLNCDEGNFVAKLNEASKYPKMFYAEAKGLELLNTTSTFKIPEVLGEGIIESTSYLLMKFLPNGKPVPNFWQVFGENLAALHKTTQQDFGLDHDNYIGSLTQKNESRKTASEFYISQRLEPQFKLALKNGFHFKNLDKFYTNISEAISEEPPSLIHGDLWSGNYMVSEKGLPALIDPAVAFASREMDLAMMKLFGGFPKEVFDCYYAAFPLQSGWKERTSLWQLYYLLVHLNLFGKGYLHQVQTIISKFH
ncbi:fructosamine kinase family protein [Aequorivita capsosiphonis]|uniref:fructosamine kinase family protein n=1 Tax=Aequorivita capsosiphonis TaxID=487317 RepID=UPI0004112BF1|nr:fructosamine kinase family protein [Aequorivita capsosiphonis]